MRPLFAALHAVTQTGAAIVLQRSGTVRSADGSVPGGDGTGGGVVVVVLGGGGGEEEWGKNSSYI